MSVIVEKVSKLYGAQKALNEVSFSVNAGEVVGFIGPNGAGKSTMMKIICAYLPATSGDVKVCGLNVNLDANDVKRHIGYLPENNPLYTDMYVREFLSYIAGVYRLGRERKLRIDQIIERTGLGPEQHKKIAALSKGYKQRVGLAQALIHDPQVLVLDEPTSGLDPNQIIEIRQLIREIGREKAVMLSTHIMQEVEAICDRVIIIDKGNIVASGQPGNLSAPQTLVTQTLIIEFASETNEQELCNIKGVQNARCVENCKWLVESKPGLDIRKEIFDFAVAKKLTVLSLQKQEQNLEEVFHQLTRKN
jgi:ABC-2 type transport system ATP-binding protein